MNLLKKYIPTTLREFVTDVLVRNLPLVSYALFLVGMCLTMFSPYYLSQPFHVDDKNFLAGDERVLKSVQHSFADSALENVRALLHEAKVYGNLDLHEIENGTFILVGSSISSTSGEAFLFHVFSNCTASLRSVLRVLLAHQSTFHQRLHLVVAVTEPGPQKSETYDQLMNELYRLGLVITASMTLNVCHQINPKSSELYLDPFGFHGRQSRIDYPLVTLQRPDYFDQQIYLMPNSDRIKMYRNKFSWLRMFLSTKTLRQAIRYLSCLMNMVDIPDETSGHAYFRDYGLQAITLRQIPLNKGTPLQKMSLNEELKLSHFLDLVVRLFHNLSTRVFRSEPLWFVVDYGLLLCDGRAQFSRYVLIIAISCLGMKSWSIRPRQALVFVLYLTIMMLVSSNLINSSPMYIESSIVALLGSWILPLLLPSVNIFPVTCLLSVVAIMSCMAFNPALGMLSSVFLALPLILTHMLRGHPLARQFVALICCPTMWSFVLEPVPGSDLDLFIRFLYVPLYASALLLPKNDF